MAVTRMFYSCYSIALEIVADPQQSLTEALGPWGSLLTYGCGLVTEDGLGL